MLNKCVAAGGRYELFAVKPSSQQLSHPATSSQPTLSSQPALSESEQLSHPAAADSSGSRVVYFTGSILQFSHPAGGRNQLQAAARRVQPR